MAPAKLPPPSHKIIGLSFGTFDLLHDGHLFHLRHARRRCDILIVALASDGYAGQLKGPGRPVEAAAQRSHNLITSGFVNLVIAVDNASQLADAAVYYEPDLLFTGRDSGRARLRARLPGLQPAVIILPFLPGHSTTDAIRARLQ
jgi:cytidyltransferase-like protein